MTNYTTEEIRTLLCHNVLVLDGAMGTMIQALRLTENDFRGSRFSGHNKRISGFNDLLNITKPDAIETIHRKYLEAGADIISTNTFNANALSMAEYDLASTPGLIQEINREGALIARKVAKEFKCRWNGRPLIAGSIGPTGKTASMSPIVTDPAYRDIDFDGLSRAYDGQIRGLIEGGVDMLLFETVFDTLNLKAGLDTARKIMTETGRSLPIMISVTLSDKAGRTLSGQTIGAFLTSVENFDNILSIGLNCSFGPSEILPHLRELVDASSHFVSCHPNAGLPNALGQYDQTPEKFASNVARMLDERLVNIIGGCCGTTPEHISAISSMANSALPHEPEPKPAALRLSGLEETVIDAQHPFVNVGERCNVAGSRKFLRLIKEKNFEEALLIAARQVNDGAMIIDINMDDALLDSKEEMQHFLRFIASDPEVARVPVMVDSSDWPTVETALKNLQGKSVVNSISLKEGEEAFIEKGRRIHQLGAAVIVMAFDEKGQADTLERKIEVSRRAYHLLLEKCGFRPDDIIIDVNVMAVATGMKEHQRYGIDFIEAVRWIKTNLPGTRTSGGISNLSFAFRGKNSLREAMHAVFLYHAIEAGLDMGIVNAAATVTYDDIDPALRSLIEDVILNRREEASDELAEYAASLVQPQAGEKKKKEIMRDLSIPVEDRLVNTVVKGQPEHIASDLDEAIAGGITPAGLIEGPLMKAMNIVGENFGDGKMFLPQVVKSARTMKMAVDHLRPYMIADKGSASTSSNGKVIFATVKGDVHDIGKNITSIVMACNNFDIIDLGVMVTPEEIVETALKEKPDIICLSGLITPSLTEMANTARALKDAGIKVPLFVGGAATSSLHTALKIAPEYNGLVVRMADASQNPIAASQILNSVECAEFASRIRREQNDLRLGFDHPQLPPYSESYKNRLKLTFDETTISKPVTEIGKIVRLDIPLSEVLPLINWKMLLHAWRLTGPFIDNFPWDGCEQCYGKWLAGIPAEQHEKATEAFRLYKDARQKSHDLVKAGINLSALVVFHKANSVEESLHVGPITLPMLRQQKDGECLSLTDFIAPEGHTDYIGAFAVTAGRDLMEMTEKTRKIDNEYEALLLQTISDRLAEAGAEWVHSQVRKKLWGYAPDENLSPKEMLEGKYRGIRPAVGYHCLPDQLLNIELARLLPLDEIGITMTENGAMSPSATVSGLLLAHPGSRYFMIGNIGDDQLKNYAEMRGFSIKKMREILPKNTSHLTENKTDL